jgi:23S rRNA (pseudouridine1915-N3)-methyltransferase
MNVYMKITLLQTGKTVENYIMAGMEIFSNRIKKYTSFEIITIHDLKNTKNMPEYEQKIREGEKILQSVSPNDYIILLDENGKEFRTTEFATWLNKVLMLPKKKVIFVIGGAWGFSEEVYARADFKLSLSKMTFPHQLVRLLFLEQLYRAFTVQKGEPYHHE